MIWFLWYLKQHCINTLNGGCTWKDYIKTADTTTGLEMLKEFELGLEEAWESECSSDSNVDEASLMNRSCQLATG